MTTPDFDRSMSRPLVVCVSTLLTVSGLAILYRGIATGAWMGGVIYGAVLTAGAMGQWLSLRSGSEGGRSAADQMIILFMVMQSAVALPALDYIEEQIKEAIAAAR